MHPDKVSLAFGIKISPHHHTPFTTPRDWHGFTSVCLIAGLIWLKDDLMESTPCQSRCGGRCVMMWVYFTLAWVSKLIHITTLYLAVCSLHKAFVLEYIIHHHFIFCLEAKMMDTLTWKSPLKFILLNKIL